MALATPRAKCGHPQAQLNPDAQTLGQGLVKAGVLSACSPRLPAQSPILTTLTCGLRMAEGRELVGLYLPFPCSWPGDTASDLLHPRQGSRPSALSDQVGPVEEMRRGGKHQGWLGPPQSLWVGRVCVWGGWGWGGRCPRVWVVAPLSMLTLFLHTCPDAGSPHGGP